MLFQPMTAHIIFELYYKNYVSDLIDSCFDTARRKAH